jgi:hypothetical protein
MINLKSSSVGSTAVSRVVAVTSDAVVVTSTASLSGSIDGDLLKNVLRLSVFKSYHGLQSVNIYFID